ISGSQSNPFDGTVVLLPFDNHTNTVLTLAMSSGATAFGGTLAADQYSSVIWSADLQIPGVNIVAHSDTTFDLANHSESLGSITFEGGGNFTNVSYLRASGGITGDDDGFGSDDAATISGNLSYL